MTTEVMSRTAQRADMGSSNGLRREQRGICATRNKTRMCYGEDNFSLTRLVKHLVALIEDEVLQIGKAKVPVADESVDTAGGTDNNVGLRVLVAKKLDVRLHGCFAVEDTNPDIGHELGETVVLVSDLVG